MPWRSVTLVPFHRRGESFSGNTSEVNSDIEIISDHREDPLQPSGVLPDEFEASFDDLGADLHSGAHSNDAASVLNSPIENQQSDLGYIERMSCRFFGWFRVGITVAECI